MKKFVETIKVRPHHAKRLVRFAACLPGLLLLATLNGCGGGSSATTGTSVLTSNAIANDSTGCSSLTGGAKVACYANYLYSSTSLSTTQQSALEIAFTKANAVNWSNLPVNPTSRNGLQYSALTTAQQTAFLAVAQSALSTAGYGTYDSIRKADDYLSANGGGGNYSSGLYHMAFLGAPSATSIWELQLTGHHHVFNIVYNNGTVTATPNFVGVEPQVFTTSGKTYAPVNSRRDAMFAIVSSLSSTQSTSAKLTTSFSDVLLGPGQDGKFPARQGLLVSSMTASQQNLVKAAIEQWVTGLPPAQASALLSAYESSTALASTYVSYSGTTTPTAQGAYVRIDGPRVWIEFCCQNGVVFSSQIHYHTVWRDKTGDYGGQFTF